MSAGRRPSVSRYTVTVKGTCPGCGERASRQRSDTDLDTLRPMLTGTVGPVWHKRCEVTQPGPRGGFDHVHPEA